MNFNFFCVDFAFWVSVLSLIASFIALCVAIKTDHFLKDLRKFVDWWFKKEDIKFGFEQHKELFKPFFDSAKDLDQVKMDIERYKMNINRIFSNRKNHDILVYDTEFPFRVNINEIKHRRYRIEFIKSEKNKRMLEICYENEKEEFGTHGFLVKIEEGEEGINDLKTGEYYFAWFRLSGSSQYIKGTWTISKGVGTQVKKYPFHIIGIDKSKLNVTADEFHKRLQEKYGRKRWKALFYLLKR